MAVDAFFALPFISGDGTLIEIDGCYRGYRCPAFAHGLPRQAVRRAPPARPR
jgi:hypothetical protein